MSAQPTALSPLLTSPRRSSAENAIFDLDDIQALRDEYEERLADLARDRDGLVDALRRERDARLAAETELTRMRQSIEGILGTAPSLPAPKTAPLPLELPTPPAVVTPMASSTMTQAPSPRPERKRRIRLR